jgi:hypothetical protein
LCAETAIPHCRNEDAADICRYVVQTCVAWSCGEASEEALREAADAAMRASIAAANAAAADAAAWAADAARANSLRISADVVRGLFPKPPPTKCLEGPKK